jgi:hypothetical protein
MIGANPARPTTIVPASASLPSLQAPSDIRRLEKYRDNRGSRFGPVGNPVSAGLDPQPPRLCELRVGPWRGQTSRRRRGYLLPSGGERILQGTGRLRPLAFLIIHTQRPDMLPGLRRERDQRRAVVLRRAPPECFASMRAMLSSSSRNTSSPDTICPAANWASLRSNAARNSASLGIGGSRSAGSLRCGVSSIGEE